MKRARGLAILLFVIFLLSGFASAQTGEQYEEDLSRGYPTEIVRAKVVDVSEYEEIEDDWFYSGRQLVTVKILTGRFQGYVKVIENYFTGIPHRDLPVKAGDQVLLLLELDQGRLRSVTLYDYVRDQYLYIMIGVFVFTVILIGRTKGLKALLTLAVMGFVVFQWILPLTLKGYNPLWLTVLFATLITVMTLGIISGIKVRTAAAIVGTIGGVLAAGIFATLFGKLARLTGCNQDAQMLLFNISSADVDLRGLTFAGIILGALGAVMHVAMSIAASVQESRAANPLLTYKGLYQAGLKVGKDLLGTMVNTLVLAYIGGALPLLLLFAVNGMSNLSVINLDIIATEIIRTIAGSFGLLVAIPVTAAAASLLINKLADKQKSGSSAGI